MSRHELTGSDGRTVVVGFDRPLQTFFGQVYDPEPEGHCVDPECELHQYLGAHAREACEDNPPILWVGGSPGECPTISELKYRLGEWRWAAVRLVGVLERDRELGR